MRKASRENKMSNTRMAVLTTVTLLAQILVTFSVFNLFLSFSIASNPIGEIVNSSISSVELIVFGIFLSIVLQSLIQMIVVKIFIDTLYDLRRHTLIIVCVNIVFTMLNTLITALWLDDPVLNELVSLAAGIGVSVTVALIVYFVGEKKLINPNFK